MIKLLVVEDDTNTREAIDSYFKNRGLETQTANNSFQAIAKGLLMRPDILITDWMLADESNGVEVAKTLKNHNTNLKIVFITAFPSQDLISQIGELSAIVLEKPLSLSRLSAALNALA
jgi:DNA-binding response OmpR family regulator